MKLPEALEQQFHHDVCLLQEELKVGYVTSWERIGEKKGMEQGKEIGLQEGMELGRRELLTSQLEYKFQKVPEKYQNLINNASPDILFEWANRVLVATTIDEVFERN
jgi:hypothetical protein